MQQTAPDPAPLAYLVERLSYRQSEGWSVRLEDIARDYAVDGAALSAGLTLIVMRVGPDSYDPDRILRVNHYFPVPPATYDVRSWQRWLFDRLGDVDTHERCENFLIHDSPI